MTNNLVRLIKREFKVVDATIVRRCGKKIPITVADNGYRVVSMLGKVYLYHRLLFTLLYGKIPVCIDHINGDKLDNRPENLREVTYSQNACNQSVKSNIKSGHKNVYWRKDTSKWQVRIKYEGEIHNFGTFADLEKAVNKATQERKRLFKEYHRG